MFIDIWSDQIKEVFSILLSHIKEVLKINIYSSHQNSILANIKLSVTI